MSTANHPQTDGSSERAIQKVEQYLRAFSTYRKDDWMEYLHLAEFAYNNQRHDTIGISPFMALYGFQPNWEIPLNPNTKFPAVDDRLEYLKKIQEDIKSSLSMAAERMKYFYDKHVSELPDFAIGSQVWLDGRNVNTNEPSAKLKDKRYGPFKIIGKPGTHTYKLQLPRTWRLHLVFHISLLSRYKKDEIPERKLVPPPPVEVEGIEQFDVEEILDSRIHHGKLQYLVKWKGYLSNENSWEPTINLKNAPQMIQNFHDTHPNRPAPPKPTSQQRVKGQYLFNWVENTFDQVNDTTHQE